MKQFDDIDSIPIFRLSLLLETNGTPWFGIISQIKFGPVDLKSVQKKCFNNNFAQQPQKDSLYVLYVAIVGGFYHPKALIGTNNSFSDFQTVLAYDVSIVIVLILHFEVFFYSVVFLQILNQEGT